MTKKPYKEIEFQQFLKMIGDDAYPSWGIIAQALEIDPDTVTSWKRLPEAREARVKAIKAALASMVRAGDKDWRMWEARLKMLGVNPPTKVDVDNNRPDAIDELLIAYGIKERPKDDRQTDDTVSGPSESKT